MIQGFARLNPSWQQTMLRIRDPKISISYYESNFGMVLINRYHFEPTQGDFSVYFLASVPEKEKKSLPVAGTPEAHKFLWGTSRKGFCTLELTHNHGTELSADLPLKDYAGRSQLYHDGNSTPRGFGHIAFNVDDVYGACAKLEANGVAMKKRPDEGNMKGLGFVLDPDGYWVEIVQGAQKCDPGKFNLSQTMLRIKDAEKSVAFYRNIFNLTLVRESHFEEWGFGLYFLATPSTCANSLIESGASVSSQSWDPCLELTWNYGTEKEQGNVYHNGNDSVFDGEPAPRGFGHIGFLVDNLDEFCGLLEQAEVEFIKKPNEGTMRNIAFVKDPTGYWIEVIQRDLPPFF